MPTQSSWGNRFEPTKIFHHSQSSAKLQLWSTDIYMIFRKRKSSVILRVSLACCFIVWKSRQTASVLLDGWKMSLETYMVL